MNTNLKRKTVIIIIILLLALLLWESFPFGNGAEKSAQNFVEHMLDGKAKKCTALMDEDLIALAGYRTKRQFINAYDNTLDSLIDGYKDQYGQRWHYDVVVIDSFAVDIFDSQDYASNAAKEGVGVRVVLEINHKGGRLFNPKKGTTTIDLIMKKTSGKWLVYDFIL